MKEKIKFSLLIIAFVAFTRVNGQSIDPDVISSSGQHFIGSSAILSWTLGEGVITTVSNTNNIITQGFHQPRYDMTKVDENTALSYVVSVFPNPVSDHLTITITNTTGRTEKLQLRLFDFTGKELATESIENSLAAYSLDMTKYSAGNFLLTITTEQGMPVSNYKIQKTY